MPRTIQKTQYADPINAKYRALNIAMTSLLMAASVFAGWLLMDMSHAERLKSTLPTIESHALPNHASAARYSALAQSAMRADNINWDLVLAATQKAIAKSPRQLDNWHRLAFILSVRDGVLSAQAEAALAHALHLSPYGTGDIMVWRLQFASDHWDALTPKTQHAISAQIPALYALRRYNNWMKNFAKTAPQPLQSRIYNILMVTHDG